MIIRELLSVFGFQVDEAGAKRANTVYGGLKTLAAGVTGAAALAAGALALMVTEAVATGSEVSKASKKFGVGAEEIQELAYAAKQSETDIGDLGTGLKNMRRRAAEASSGNKEMAKGFAQLGVKVTDTHGKVKPTTELLGEVADKLNALPDDAKRSAVAMRIFGLSGTNLLPFLAEGSVGIERLREEARRLGFVLDSDTVEKLKELGDVGTDIGLIFKAMRQDIVKGALPGLLEAAKMFKELGIAIQPLISKYLVKFGELVGSIAVGLAKLSVWLVQNRRFVAILGVVIGVVAAGKILLMAQALGLLRWEFIKTALTFGLQFIVIAGLILLVALLIEDIATGAKGLRELRDYFVKEAQKPDANWMVKIVAWLLDGFIHLIDNADLFFKGFFEDAEKMGGTWEALKNAGGVAIDFWIQKLGEFGDWLAGHTGGKQLFDLIGNKRWDPLHGLVSDTNPTEDLVKGKAGGFKQTRLSAGQGPQHGGQTIVNAPIDLTVHTGNVTDSADSIGEAVKGATKEAMTQWVNDTASEFTDGVVR